MNQTIQGFTLTVASLALFLAPSSPLQAPAAADEHPSVRSTRIKTLQFKRAEVTQFLAADRKDHLFLLRGDTLEVFRLDDEPKPLGKLKCSRPPETAYAAAMNPAGSTWAVATSIDSVALCDFVEQKQPRGLGGWVSSMTYSWTGPLIAVLPHGTMDLAGQMEDPIPRVLALDDDNWKPVSWAPVPEFAEHPKSPFREIKAQTDRHICSGPKDSIWLASWNAYRLEQASSSEKPSRVLVVGSGEVKWTKFSDKEQERMTADVKARGLDPRGVAQVYPEQVIRALLCGRDGLLYLLVNSDKGLALDRFSPSMATLERVWLEGVEVSRGPMTAVMTRDEIVFGGRFAEDGLWRISLESLADADWKPVPGAKLNGKPLS